MLKKMKILRIIVLMFIPLLFSSIHSNAQDVWNLKRCIVHATENNIDLLQGENTLKTEEIRLKQNRMELLPDLSLGSGLDLNFGRNIDPNDNSVTYDPTYTNNIWLTSSVTLFNGFAKQNAIRYQKHILAAEKHNLEFQKNQLYFEIINQYYKAIYSKALLDVAAKQVDLSTQQLNRMKRLIEVGRESAVSLFELESQLASDQFLKTQAENQFQTVLFDLKQILRLDPDQSLIIEDLPNEANDQLNFENVNPAVFPQIQSKKEALIAANYQLRRSKGFFYPSLNLSAGYSSGYFDGAPESYTNQLNTNQNQWMSLRLNIPIFNNYSVRSNVKTNRILVDNSMLELEKQEEALKTTIAKAKNDYLGAQRELQSAKALFNQSEKNLEVNIKKLEKGMANVNDYRIARQDFVRAEAGVIKASIELEIKKHMMNFYKNANWTHLEL